MGRASIERHWHRGCLGLDNSEPQDPLVSSGLRNKVPGSGCAQPRLPAPRRMSGSPLQLPTSARLAGTRQRRSLGAPPAPWQNLAAGPRRPALCSRRSRPWAPFFSREFMSRTKGAIIPGLPWLLPRPVAQVSHAVPVSQPAFSLCLWEQRLGPCSLL